MEEGCTHILDMIESQGWSPSCVLQGFCGKGLIVAMDEAVEGRKVVQGLWDGEVLEQGEE